MLSKLKNRLRACYAILTKKEALVLVSDGISSHKGIEYYQLNLDTIEAREIANKVSKYYNEYVAFENSLERIINHTIFIK